MAITIKTPREVAQEYLDNLKVLRPEVNIDQEDSDWWIRSRVIGGVISGVYADLSRVSNDAFPQSARRESVDKHLQVYFGTGLRDAQPAVGYVAVTGVDGMTIPINTQFTHTVTSNVYVVVNALTLSGTTGAVSVQSVASGQSQNLVTNAPLVVNSPPSGLEAAATVIFPGITDGRDVESTAEGAARVLARIRNPSRGGTEIDYENWAVQASASVTSVRANRHKYGLGTMQLVISAGTNDIDAAIDSDSAVIIQPSAELKETVRAYAEAMNPATDIVYVDGPTEHTIAVQCQIAFISGTVSTIEVTTGKTQGELVAREIKRAIYKTPIGGRSVNGVSEVRVADIEDQIVYNLSGLAASVGLKFQIVGDRKVTITGGTPNLVLLPDEIAIPGVLTIEDM